MMILYESRMMGKVCIASLDEALSRATKILY